LLQTLLIRKVIKKLALNKRGFSSIVGAIFAILAIISLTSGIFVWSINQNTVYNNTVRQSTQLDIDRLNEKALANVTAYYVNDNYVKVNGTLQNVGSLTVTLNTLWVVDSNTNEFYSTSPLNLTLKAGSTTTLTGPTALMVPLLNKENHTRICWFVSSRGNIISQYSLVLASIENANVTNIIQTGNFTNTIPGNTTSISQSGNITNINTVGGSSTTYANVSQGIGLIAFDFKGFSHQDIESQPSTNNYLLSGLVKTYQLSQSHYMVLHVTLTNFDPTQKTMYINPGSAIYYVGSHSGTTKYNTWNLVNVTGSNSTGWYLNDATQNPFAVSYVLPYMVPVDVFFAGVGNSGGSVDQNVYPLNIMVFGKLGTDAYGQNVPFVAAYIT
jgi:hypothetical protein